MLQEPILALLPADESTILEVIGKSGKIMPDPILRRLRRLQRFGAVHRRRDGMYEVVPKDEVEEAERDAEGKEATCSACEHVLPLSEFIGAKGVVTKCCRACREKAKVRQARVRQIPTKHCPRCRSDRLKTQFRYNRNTNDHLERICKACEELE